jgi:hypothetical protein
MGEMKTPSCSALNRRHTRSAPDAPCDVCGHIPVPRETAECVIVRDVDGPDGYRLEVLMGEPYLWWDAAQAKVAWARGLKSYRVTSRLQAQRFLAARPAGFWLASQVEGTVGDWRLLRPATVWGRRKR